jgi:hypothetical protein
LRLWLTIFIEAPNELIKSQKAILPSLDFKIRQGDSLVQLIGKVNFPIAEHSRELNNEARKKLEDLRIAKSKYFENIDGIDVKSLKKKELSIYVEMIENQLDRIKEELPKLELEKTYASSSLFGELDSSDPNISRLEKLIANKLAQSNELIGQLTELLRDELKLKTDLSSPLLSEGLKNRYIVVLGPNGQLTLDCGGGLRRGGTTTQD